MVQKILRSTEPKLRLISKPVLAIDKKVLRLIQDLKDTLAVQKNPEGVGLAAPQIGVNLRVFLAKYKKFERLVINPEIVSKTQKHKNAKTQKTKSEILEGCLSIPNHYGPLKRAEKVKVKYKTLSTIDGSPITVVEEFTNFEAQIILHEIDHLNGILFIDHILKEKKPLYKLTGKKWEEVEL